MAGMLIDKDAPDFGRGKYPSGGELIGPAWVRGWSLLCDGEWHQSGELAGAMCWKGRIANVTAMNLIRAARRAGVLDVRRPKAKHGGNAQAEYRIADAYR
jgi:hypothetical protein